ncbi:Smr/MutS family protein [Castellaniella ginsengisoli]|uniref:Smr/MutS family protein n=1 Tax=Castellaniella ginsengisoli TaxID=546114 RepID=A0AB39CME6_9BURK
MKASKSSLADLRRLRAEAAPPEPPAAPRRPAGKKRVGRDAAEPSRHETPDNPAAASRSEAHAVAPPLDPADRALFRQAMRFVQPLPDRGPRARAGKAPQGPESLLQARRRHAQGAATEPPPTPAHRQRRKIPALDPEAEAFLQAGCGPDLLRGLRRGKWIPQASLDLHGSTLDQARERLDRFLASCLEHDIRCVRIIHGKGIGSRQGEPVLKAAVRQHLCRLDAVQAWVRCNESEGGEGALHALLRQTLPPQA